MEGYVWIGHRGCSFFKALTILTEAGSSDYDQMCLYTPYSGTNKCDINLNPMNLSRLRAVFESRGAHVLVSVLEAV